MIQQIRWGYWRILISVLAVSLLAFVAACGGDDDDDGGATTEATSPPAATQGSGPGTVTLTSTAIQGQSGKILLVFATSGSDRVARACVPISSDDFTLSGEVMTDIPAGNDPCGDGTAETTFEEGSYTITAGVYVGGEQTPVAETTTTVEVAGDVTAELDGAELSQ